MCGDLNFCDTPTDSKHLNCRRIIMLVAALLGFGLLLPGSPKASSNGAKPTFDRRAALAVATAAVAQFAPAPAMAAKKDKGPEANLGGPPMGKNSDGFGLFGNNNPAPQFRPAGATKSGTFKPPPLGKVRLSANLGPPTPRTQLILYQVACSFPHARTLHATAAGPQEDASKVFQEVRAIGVSQNAVHMPT